MNYTEITALALSYSDRDDTEVSDRVDDFLKMVESRVNRKLKTLEAEDTVTLSAVPASVDAALPSTYSGFKEVNRVSSGSVKTLKYLTPEALKGLTYELDSQSIGNYYSISDNKILYYPELGSGETITAVMFLKVPALTSTATTNWVSDDYPDCYVFGLLVEISAFVKDAEAKKLWDQRFIDSLNEIDTDDRIKRWSGSPLETRVG